MIQNTRNLKYYTISLFFASLHLFEYVFYSPQRQEILKIRDLSSFFSFVSLPILFCKWVVGMITVYDVKCKSLVRVLEICTYVRFEEDIMRATSCNVNLAGKGSWYKTKFN